MQRITRDRYLTPEEAARYAEIRRLVMIEFPPIRRKKMVLPAMWNEEFQYYEIKPDPNRAHTFDWISVDGVRWFTQDGYPVQHDGYFVKFSGGPLDGKVHDGFEGEQQNEPKE